MTQEQIKRLDVLRNEKQKAVVFLERLITKDYLKIDYAIKIQGHGAQNSCHLLKENTGDMLEQALIKATQMFIKGIDEAIEAI